MYAVVKQVRRNCHSVLVLLFHFPLSFSSFLLLCLGTAHAGVPPSVSVISAAAALSAPGLEAAAQSIVTTLEELQQIPRASRLSCQPMLPSKQATRFCRDLGGFFGEYTAGVMSGGKSQVRPFTLEATLRPVKITLP